ncbi:MAG: flotillin-like FloA family protein [Planctomycetota bacterium]
MLAIKMQLILGQEGPPSQANVDGSMFFVLVMLALATVFLLVLLGLLWFFGRHWLRAFLAGTPISLIQIVTMVLRGSDASTIIDQGIQANQAGHPIAWHDLERAHIAGGDLPTITTAYCVSRNKGKHFSIDELLKASLESRLDKLLES